MSETLVQTQTLFEGLWGSPKQTWTVLDTRQCDPEASPEAVNWVWKPETRKGGSEKKQLENKTEIKVTSGEGRCQSGHPGMGREWEQEGRRLAGKPVRSFS